MSYIDLNRLRRYLDIKEDGDDALLESFLAAAQAEIESQTGRRFEAAADSVRYFDKGALSGRDLFLDEDLAAITSITNGDGTAIAADKYTTQPRNQWPAWLLTLKAASGVSWSTADEIAITGRWAYSVEAPADIQQATLELAAYYYRRKKGGADQDRIVYFDNGMMAPSNLPKSVLATINRYRRLV
jgi:uncharacterized phiE125 gp8 family phage protein